jgi:VCBS repeat-containing protein
MTTVTVIPSPVVTANSTAASVCAGGSVTLTGSGASTYTWDNNVINAVSFVPTATTTYMVTGTDSNGCTNTATITVTVNPLPIVTANSSAASVCAGAGVTLTGGGASTYTWNNNVIDAISFVPTATTTYMVTGTDSNGCVNTATTTVIVNPLPVVTATSSAASVCTGGSVILTGGGASTYTWNNNVMNAFPFIPSATNTYMVTGTDVNGCVNTATVTVTVNGLLVVALGPNIIQCGGSAILNAGNPGSFYLWNNASTTQTISVSASGTYIVVVTDANGCTGSDTALVTINNAPAVTASASSVIVCVDDAVVTLTGTPTGGVWSGPGVTGFTLSPVATGVGLQTAIYSYTDANGCEGIASVNVQVNACVGLAENILANGVSVYPNPNNGSFTLGVNANVGALTIKITDMQGRVVYASVENNVNAGFVKQISLDTQSCGMYLMHIITNGEQQTKKISVQK